MIKKIFDQLADIFEEIAYLVACYEAGVLGPVIFSGIPEEVPQAGFVVAHGARAQLLPRDMEGRYQLLETPLPAVGWGLALVIGVVFGLHLP